MTDVTTSELQFLHYDVNKIHFVSNPNFEVQEIEIDMEFNADIERSEEFIAQKVSIEIFPNGIENGMPFHLQIDATGHFRLVTDATSLDTNDIEINTLSIMFPYLRSLVTTITANANVPPLILPPINIVKTLEKKQKEI